MASGKALGVLFAVMVGCGTVVGGSNASEPPSAEPDFHQPLRQRAQELAATGQPLELLVASWLALPQELSAQPRPADAPDRSDVWLDQAIRAGSDQPVIARAAVSRCIAGGSCDVAAAIDTLRTREADEALAQVLLWQMALAQGDDMGAAAAWQRVVQARRFVDEYAEGVGLLDRMTGGVRLPVPTTSQQADPDLPRVTMVHAIAAALLIRPLVELDRQCGGQVDAERREGCLHLAAVMADSTSRFVGRFGINKLEANAQDEAERKRWQERRRQLHWTIENAAALQGTEAEGKPGVMQAFTRWMGESGELPAMRRLLAEHGMAAQPPTDWQPTLFLSK